MKFFLLFFCLIILSGTVSAISLSGSPMPIDLYYEYGVQKEYTYRFGTASHIQDYKTSIYSKADYDIKKFISITPDYFKQIPRNSGAEFKIKIDFSEEEITPGRHEAIVILSETETSSGGTVGALAQVGVQVKITAIYPTEYINWEVKASDANIGEDISIETKLTNWGKPAINDAYIIFKIYDNENNLVKEIESERVSLESKEEEKIVTSIPSDGLKPDDYLVRAKIVYAGNEEIKEDKFRLGTKEVKILSISDNFFPEAINVFEAKIESGWNNDIDVIKGEVKIFDGEEQINSFKLQETSLRKWQEGVAKGYFETFGITKGDYKALVTLNYEDSRSSKEFDIKVSDEGTAEITEQKPLNISSILNMNTLILVALVIILGMNIWYLMDRRKR